MFWYRLVTVIALALLGLGVYSTFDSETHLAERAAAAGEMPRKRVDNNLATPEDDSQAQLRDNWLRSDTLRQDTTFVDAKGRRHALQIAHYWTRDTLLRSQDADKRVAYYLNGDTLHFLSFARLRATIDNKVVFTKTLTRADYAGAIEDTYLDVYMLQHTRFAGWSEAAQCYLMEQALGLPSGVSWTRTWLTLSEAGKVTQRGNGGTCHGGVQLSTGGTHLLTCDALLGLSTPQSTRDLRVHQPAISRWLNDTLFLLVEDMPEGVSPNAHVRNIAGDTLLSFMYHGYERLDFYRSGTALLGKYAYLINPYVDELIVLNMERLEQAQVMSLRKLQQYHTHQQAKTQLCFAFKELEQCCIYLGQDSLPQGITLKYAPQPS